MSTDTATLHLDGSTFASQTGEGVVLVDFWAPWCGPCLALGPTIDKLASEYQGRVKVAKVNVDDAPEIGQQYGVNSIPTIVILKDGEEVDRAVGLRQHADLAASLDRQLG